MAFQKSDFLALDGLSILDDPRPSLSQPVLENGVYLRWAFGPQRAFPLHGYHLFRRIYADSGRHCLATVIGPRPLGPLGSDKLDTTLGRLWATEGPLLLTDDFDPHGSAEVSLAGLRSLQLDLPAGVLAWKVTAKIGFLPQQPTTEIDFRKSPTGAGPNPRIEGDIQFVSFRKPGERMPSTRIRTGPRGNGIECSPRLAITLTRPAVRLSMIFSRRKQDPPLEIKAWNQDGTVAASARYEGDGVTLNLEGKAITQVVINAPSELALLQWLKVDRQNDSREIEAFVMRGNQRATSTRITGKPGEVMTTEFRVEDVNTVMFSGGPAALIDLCYWVRGGSGSTTQPKPWAKVPGFPYPLTLPITHPGYPASAGTEALSVRRAEAAQRIHYGSAAEALPAKPRTPGPGTITMQRGSALVTGKGTNWDTSLVGQMLFPRTLDTALAVMAVLAPDRLVLSRPYLGWGFEDFPYELATEDVFAQVHDQIGAVLGVPTAMRAATIPPVIEQSRRGQNAVLQDGSTQVMGQGTSWSRNLEGLLLEAGPNGNVYRIVEVKSAQEIILHAPYVGKGGTFPYRILSRSPDNRIEDGPSLQIRPLDLLELASLTPPYAQLLGLSWIDASAERDVTYDYMLLADHGGRFNRDGTAALAWLNGTPDFESNVVDGSLLNITHSGSGALAAPSALQVFALPAGGGRQTLKRPDLADAEPGLSITDLAIWRSRPPTQRPLLVDVWRLSHGTQPPPATPPGPETYKSIDRFVPPPTPRDDKPAPPRPPGWPDPTSVHFIDAGTGGLDVGWYSYRMSVVDLWGRYSALSPPIPWHDIADGHQRHTWAVHLEDRTAPPPPTDVMAWVLEPEWIQDPARVVNDPMRVADKPYSDWRAQPGIGPQALGLRVRWRWPWSHELSAPDLAEFRVYAQGTPLNARFHRILSVVPVQGDATRSWVQLAVADRLENDAYVCATLQVKERGYPIEGSRGGANLELWLKNGGPMGGEAPPAGTDATIVLPPGQSLHRNGADPRHWERWFGAVAQEAPTNATVRYDIDVMEDPDLFLYDEPANPLRGKIAVWNQAEVHLDDLPPLTTLTNVRPGIDVLALASDAAGVFARLDIASVGPGPKRIVPVAPVPALASGSYRWAVGPLDRGLRGIGARWTEATRTLDLLPPKISRVRPGIDRIFLRAASPVAFDLVFDIESVDATRGKLVLGGAAIKLFLTDGQRYDWRIGKPVRIYEAFFPAHEVGAPDDPQIAKKWLKPSLSEPVVYGTIGVSAADKRTEVADVYPDRTPPRPGNEGLLGSPATVFRVYRTKPDTPADGAWDAERLLATRADYHGKSYFSVRWPKPGDDKRPYFKALIFRASEETLFQVDMDQKRTFPLTFIAENDPRPSHWSETRKADAAKTLFDKESKYAELRALPDDPLEEKLEQYRRLSNDALSVLANLQGNDEAFAQVTIEPLDLANSANDDRRGPDDPTGFPPPKPATTNAWLDTLPGLVQNRYLYKIAFVDSAQNRGPLGKASPPVYLPKVVPPRTPVITKIVGGDRQITIHWAANREPDLAGYRVYRTEDKEKARDVRSMDSVATVGIASEWTDTTVVELKTYLYRVTAVDTAANESPPSDPASGKAFNDSLPPIPTFDELHVLSAGNGKSVRCRWSSAYASLVEKKADRERLWTRLTGWLDGGSHIFVDPLTDGIPHAYRLRIRNLAGLESLGEPASPAP